MKTYLMQFNRFPYYEHLKIVHLFDTMHIGKNIKKLLWRILYGRNDKEIIINICSDIQEANHAFKSVIINSNGDGREQNISLLVFDGALCIGNPNWPDSFQPQM